MSEEKIKEPVLKRLQSKWGLKSIYQTIMVLVVFAFTGSTVVFIKPYLFSWIGFDQLGKVESILLYLLMITPLYQILILIYGFLFGQFEFFWNWEKKFFARITGRSRRKVKN